MTFLLIVHCVRVDMDKYLFDTSTVLKILNQPHSARIGNELKKILENNKQNNFDTFYVIVAYVSSNGVSYLHDAIKSFKRTEGEAKAVVGIDQKITSYRGLESMLSLFNEVHVFHNNAQNTFHPKIYAFEKKDKVAVIFVGSGNLTEGGLDTNYETCLRTELNLSRTSDKEIFCEFKKTFNRYRDTNRLSHKLDAALLKKLKEGGYVSTIDKKKSTFKPRKHPSLFGTEHIPRSKRKTESETLRIKITKPVADHISRGDENTQEIYKLLQEYASHLGNDFKIKPVQTYIAFKRSGSLFLTLRIRSNYIRVEIKLKDRSPDPKKLINKPRKDRPELQVIEKFQDQDKLEALMNLVKQSYHQIKNKNKK